MRRRGWCQVHLTCDHRRDPSGGGGRADWLLPGDRACRGELLSRHRPSYGLHRARSGHRRGGDRGRRRSVEVIVDGNVVVPDVGDVSDVDLPDVVVRCVIPGMKFLSRAQRHPADRTRGQRRAQCHAGADADEAHQRRGIDRRPGDGGGAGCPGPALAEPHPAAIMERRESPRSIVDPGPAPGRDIGPMALTIRDPGGGYRRVPDLAVVWCLAPAAAVDQVTAAGHRDDLSRYRRCRRRRRSFRIQTFGQECVPHGRTDVALETIGPADRGGLVGGDPQRHPWTIDLCRTLDHGDQGWLIGGADDDVVTAIAVQADQAARGLNRPCFIGREAAQVQMDLALGRDTLQSAGIQGGDVELGCAGHGDAARRDLQLRLGRWFGPECIAAAERIIRCCGGPLCVAEIMERDRAGDGGNAADAFGWVGLIQIRAALVRCRQWRWRRLRERGERQRGIPQQRGQRRGCGQAEQASIFLHRIES